jgi:hypothetical protein
VSARVREVMFRIGGEEDLLDCRPAVPTCAPPPNQTPIPTASAPAPPAPATSARPTESDTAGEAEAPNVPAPAAPNQGTPKPHLRARDARTLDMQAPPVPSAPLRDEPKPHPPAPHRSVRDVPAPAPPARVPAPRPIRAPSSPPRSRSRGPHHDWDAGTLYQSPPPARRRPRPQLRGLTSTIAWVNALILALLVLAAVIGHTPPSTTAARPERSVAIARAPARAVTPVRITRPELVESLREALRRERGMSRGRRPRAHLRPARPAHRSVEFAR